MGNTKLGFDEFIAAVKDCDKDFVTELHQDFMAHGCKIEVKEAKSGYVVSYILGKRTVVNCVFRKSGLIIRIYGGHIQAYMNIFEALPQGMVKALQAAPDCRRMLNPESCNSRCPMGYEYLLREERLQKCRYSAFMFPICAENNGFIKAFIDNELKACV